jgi:hypothetical protein
MAWDTTKPTDTNKLRTLGSVIRPNWTAIEEADSTFKPQATNYANRTPLGVSNDPTAISEAYITYCKDDGSGNPELFGIDQDSVISQLSFTDRSLAQSGYVYLSPGLLMQWGRGTMSAGTQTKAVTFPKTFSSTAWSLTTTPYNSPITGSSPRQWGASDITASGFNARSWNGQVPSGGVAFGWFAVGPM